MNLALSAFLSLKAQVLDGKLVLVGEQQHVLLVAVELSAQSLTLALRRLALAHFASELLFGILELLRGALLRLLELLTLRCLLQPLLVRLIKLAVLDLVVRLKLAQNIARFLLFAARCSEICFRCEQLFAQRLALMLVFLTALGEVARSLFVLLDGALQSFCGVLRFGRLMIAALQFGVYCKVFSAQRIELSLQRPIAFEQRPLIFVEFVLHRFAQIVPFIALHNHRLFERSVGRLQRGTLRAHSLVLRRCALALSLMLLSRTLCALQIASECCELVRSGLCRCFVLRKHRVGALLFDGLVLSVFLNIAPALCEQAAHFGILRLGLSQFVSEIISALCFLAALRSLGPQQISNVTQHAMNRCLVLVQCSVVLYVCRVIGTEQCFVECAQSAKKAMLRVFDCVVHAAFGCAASVALTSFFMFVS